MSDRAIEELTEAIRFTVEYVGTETLPPIAGWSWFDALMKYAPEKAAAFLRPDAVERSSEDDEVSRLRAENERLRAEANDALAALSEAEADRSDARLGFDFKGRPLPPTAPAAPPSEPLCRCGHVKSEHARGSFSCGRIIEGSGCELHVCSCSVFRYGRPPRPSISDEAEAGGLTKEERSEIRHAIQEGDTAGVLVYVESIIAALLQDHKVIGWGREPWTAKCKCGIETLAPVSKTNWMPPNHAAHVASLLAVLVADAQADAWDEGWDEAVNHRDCTYHGPGECPDMPDNPYSSGEGEKLQQQPNASEGEEHAGSDKVVGTHTPHNTPNRSENE